MPERKPHSEETKLKISNALRGKSRPWSKYPVLKGEKNPEWKGHKVGYAALHEWVRKWLGSPDKCEHCPKVAYGKHINWANKSGEYKRDLTDWLRLCVPCHRKYDFQRKT